MRQEKDIPVSLLHRWLSYCQVTGKLTWRITRGKAIAGSFAGSPMHGYQIVGLRGERYRAHRIVWAMHHGEWPDGELDHKDTDRSNNRIGNLRLATRSDNHANTHLQSNNGSGYKGVRYIADRDRFAARIIQDGNHIHLGYFATAEEAAHVYDEAAVQLYGEFARTNLERV